MNFCRIQMHFRSSAPINRRFFSTKKNYYEVLGVSKNATKQEIKTAFVTLSKKYHPDVMSASTSKDQNSSEKFVEINEAYSVLSKEESRREYDRSLNDFRRPPPDTFYQQPPRYPPPPPSSGFGGPYRDPWRNEFWQEYFRQREKTSPPNGFSPEDRRNAERKFWLFFLTLIFLSTIMNLMFRAKFPADGRDFAGPFHGRHRDTTQPRYERELREEQTRRLLERYKEEEKFRARMYKEEQERRQRQDEESYKLRPHPSDHDDRHN